MKIQINISIEDDDKELIIDLDNWRFALAHMSIFVIWVWLNALGGWDARWDLYPLLMMGALLSCQLAYIRGKENER